MIETVGTAAEISAGEVGAGKSSLDFDSSMAMDFSNDSDSSNFATEKDGNKETEGQIKENLNVEQNKPDTSKPLDFSINSENLVETGKDDVVNTKEAQDFSNNRETIIETDDNGKPYKENGELLPNNEYTIRGYEYKTDDQGRIISASGDLKWKDHEGRLDMPDSIHDIGKGSERSTDDRGHLIADEFNGSGGKENLVPMDSYVNQHGDYRKLEKEWEQILSNNEKVHVDVDVDYNGDSRRPESFTVAYDTGGEHYEKTFLNEDTRGEI